MSTSQNGQTHSSNSYLEHGACLNFFNQILTQWSVSWEKYFDTTKLQFETSVHVQSQLLVNICYLQTNMMSRWSLYWGYTFINRVYRWRHEGGHVIFPRILTGVQNSHFKCQSPQNLWTWSLKVINSVKGHYAICRLDYVLRKTTWSSWWHLWPGILSKSNSNLYSHFKAYHKTWK